MGEEKSYCNTALGLSLAIGGQYVPEQDYQHNHRQEAAAAAAADLSLHLSFTLCSKDAVVVDDDDDHKANISRSTDEDDEHDITGTGRKSVPTKNYNNGRKKLRLTKEQYSLLEDTFKLHTTLNPAQKQALSKRLNLKPRQVEVWFQNRRARTKLKQTEIDCEYLKKCCQDLSDENRRLKKEVQELRALKARNTPVLTQPLKHAATLAMCSSCEKTCKSL